MKKEPIGRVFDMNGKIIGFARIHKENKQVKKIITK